MVYHLLPVKIQLEAEVTFKMPHKTRKQRKAANPAPVSTPSRQSPAKAVSTALTSPNLLTPEMAAYTKDLADWEAQNARCREIIMNTLIPGSEPWKIAEQFEKASDIWKALNDRYGNKDEPFPNMGVPGFDVPPPRAESRPAPKSEAERERIRKKAAQDAQQLKKELLEQVLAYDIDLSGSDPKDVEAFEERKERLKAMTKLTPEQESAAFKQLSESALRSLESLDDKAPPKNAASRRRQNSRSQQKMSQFLCTLDSTLAKLTTIASSIAELQPGPAMHPNHVTSSNTLSSLGTAPAFPPPATKPPACPISPPLTTQPSPPTPPKNKGYSNKATSPPISTAYPDPSTLAPSLFKFPEELARNQRFLWALINGDNVDKGQGKESKEYAPAVS